MNLNSCLVKGKKQPPICKEVHVIRICYELDHINSGIFMSWICHELDHINFVGQHHVTYCMTLCSIGPLTLISYTNCWSSQQFVTYPFIYIYWWLQELRTESSMSWDIWNSNTFMLYLLSFFIICLGSVLQVILTCTKIKD